jgi:hypothetical protein
MKHAIAAGAAALLTAACTTPATETAAMAEPDPRQGAEVRQICFTQQIRGWREHDRRSIIVEKGVNQEFKLDLIGTCQPDDAFLTVGLDTRVGSGTCLSTGDRLVTDVTYDGSCSIRRIYEWNKDAGAATASAN